MTRERTIEAIKEAKRFIQKASAAIDANEKGCNWMSGSKESGAARRASMDLTRALSDMRRWS